MDLSKSYKILNWVLIGSAVILLWLSLRSPVNQVEYSIAALVAWGLAWLVNRVLKKHNEESEKDR